MRELITEVFSVLRGTFLDGDWIALLIAFGSVFVASALMQRASQVGSMTLLALVLFAIGGLLRTFFAGPGPTEGAEGGRVVSLVDTSFNSFLTQSAGTLVAYFLAFLVLILVIYYGRQVVKIGGGGH